MLEIRDITDFANYVGGRILGFLGSDYKDASVELMDIKKNNGTVRIGLVIKKPGCNLAPTLYLEQFFEAYEKGLELDAVMKQIADCRLMHEANNDFDLDAIYEFKMVEDMIVPRLINKDMNAELLSNCPYKVTEDLAATFHVLLPSADGVMASICITNELAEKWGVNARILYDCAMKNMAVLLPPTFRGMGQVLSELLNSDEDSMFDLIDASDFLFVASNKRMQFGASCILDLKFMDKIREKIGDYYVIPCSVHEVIIVPAMNGTNVSDIVEMIKTVNTNELQECDILSYNCYLYDSKGFRIAESKEALTA